MDINFDSFKEEIASFERVWKKAHKEGDKGKMAAVLLAFAIQIKKWQSEITNLAELMSKCATSEIMEQIKKS